MKSKFSLIAFILFSTTAFCQDSASFKPHNKVIFKNEPQVHSTISPAEKINGDNTSTKQSPIYRDTRLGSSSPMYNTYQKNDNGAGSVTNDPNKGVSGSPVFVAPATDSIKH